MWPVGHVGWQATWWWRVVLLEEWTVPVIFPGLSHRIIIEMSKSIWVKYCIVSFLVLQGSMEIFSRFVPTVYYVPLFIVLYTALILSCNVPHNHT